MSLVSIEGRLSRAWYGASVCEFLQTQPDNIIGQLSRNSDFAIETTQADAWLAEIAVLQNTLTKLAADRETWSIVKEGALFFEFVIPRMGRRIDVVLVTGPVVFAIEFKAGESVFKLSGILQVWDYALDLKNFHETSHNVSIVPLLVATGASSVQTPQLRKDADGLYRPLQVTTQQLGPVVMQTLAEVHGRFIDPSQWVQGVYRPTPTIVEAARALYSQHSVEAISRYDAGAKNLSVTSKRIEQLIEEARTNRKKVICFVTGVPGAGKTLVGLNVATHKRDSSKPTHAVFLSGNGPLVDVLREALARDEYARKKGLKESARKGQILESVKAFIQNVHHFRDEGLRDSSAPADHVVIFDEAQRAWNLQATANFMQRKKNRPGFAMSEPQFLISYMDRHDDWAFIVCLVGGGQEINLGEAGISAWISAVVDHFPHWDMIISDKLSDSEYAAVEQLSQIGQSSTTDSIRFDESLHLSVSMRSFRAENVSNFIKLLLDLNEDSAREQLDKLRDRYSIKITRDLGLAKSWIREKARGSERFGMVASSKAMRLKPHAIDVRYNINPVMWFLNDRDDVRSSYYLEDVATEFQVQGLELDWVCVNWDADLRKTPQGWSYHDFRGCKWQNINALDRQRYTLNAYRVLLTRARQGMVLFVPPGDAGDFTRPPEFYDETFRYLTGLGIESVEGRSSRV